MQQTIQCTPAQVREGEASQAVGTCGSKRGAAVAEAVDTHGVWPDQQLTHTEQVSSRSSNAVTRWWCSVHPSANSKLLL